VKGRRSLIRERVKGSVERSSEKQQGERKTIGLKLVLNGGEVGNQKKT
jgi:hypothetical protein